ncbi:hypothetical protein DL96DRAFT_1702490 [Flagelloscypha sp. PMI_526]|nr:hypothetical protein DL96DRAFT_1702490 [Flagelloscypha sp. PMI_526]
MRRLLPSKRLASGFDNARHPTSDSFIDEVGLNSQFDSSGTSTFPPSSIQPLRLSVPDRAPSKPHRATPTANTVATPNISHLSSRDYSKFERTASSQTPYRLLRFPGFRLAPSKASKASPPKERIRYIQETVKYHIVNRPDSIAETLPPAYEEVDPETHVSPSYPHSDMVAPAMGRPRADTGTRRPLPLKPAPQTSSGDLDKVRLRPNSRAPPPTQRTWETSYSYAVHAQGEESDELADDDAYTVEEILDEFRDLRLSSATPHFLATAERPDSIYSVSSHSFSPDDRLFSMIPSRNTA